MVYSNEARDNVDLVKAHVSTMLKEMLRKDFTYHNLNHTIEVYKGVKTYARMECLSPEQTQLLLVAALLHDIGFIWQYEKNAPIASSKVREILLEYNFTEQEITEVQRLVLVTTNPQKPDNLMEKILCDADRDWLGKSNFIEKMMNLRKEWGIKRNRIYTDKEWLELEIDFLSNHQYFTSSAKKLRNATKIQNVRRLKAMLSANSE